MNRYRTAPAVALALVVISLLGLCALLAAPHVACAQSGGRIVFYRESVWQRYPSIGCEYGGVDA
jgi:hypothetical protein